MALITCKDCKKQFSEDAKRCVHCGADKPQRYLILRCIIGVCIIFAFIQNQHDNTPPYQDDRDRQIAERARQMEAEKLAKEKKKEEDNAKKRKNAEQEHIQIMENLALQPQLFLEYGTLKGNFTIENQSNYGVKDIEIYCFAYGSSGTLLNNVPPFKIYQIFSAKSSKTMGNIRLGYVDEQTASVKCNITNFLLESDL